MSSVQIDLKGKICLITGANSGIGKSTALGLAKQGAHIVMLCRDQNRGEKAQQEIISKSKNNLVDLLYADLGSLKSLKNFIKSFKEKYTSLHILINNAGVNFLRRKETVDGFEGMFGINHIGHFYLTIGLLDLIKQSAPSRIINVASRAQRKIDFDDLQSEKSYSFMKVYGKSKLANILFTYELARRLEGSGVTVNCLHPGGVRTNLARGTNKIAKIIGGVISIFLMSPEKGAATSIYLASSPNVAKVTGKYFIKKQEVKSSTSSYDVEAAQLLWKKSEELITKAMVE